MSNRNNIRIAIQKSGRLTQGSLNMLRSCGFVFQTYSQQLYSPCENFPLEVIYLRDDDIPGMVFTGAADLGIVHDIVLREYESKFRRRIPLGFGKCSLVVAALNNSNIKSISDLRNKKVATSYPATTEKFFAKQGIPIEVIKLNGCVEIMPRLGKADAISDLTSTGSSLSWHNLRPIENIHCDLDTFLIVGEAVSTSVKKKEIADFLINKFCDIIKKHSSVDTDFL